MDLWTSIFAKTKAPLTPLYGGFPVKLVTHLGDFIDPSEFTVDELRAETLISMQKMIKTYQKLPGNVLRGIKERLEDDFESDDDQDYIECNSEVDEFEEFKTISTTSKKFVKSHTEDEIESFKTCCFKTYCECDIYSDSGCVSVASVEEDCSDNFITLTPSITQLPNGRLVLTPM